MKTLTFKKSQVWVETAVYTLIGLTIIAILLAIATPQIEKIKDRSIIRQTIDGLNDLDSKILEVEQAPANIRVVELRISKGKLEINSGDEFLRYIMQDSPLMMSQENSDVQYGNIVLRTEKFGKNYNIMLKLNYSSSINITYDKKDDNKTFFQSGTPYRIYIENVGDNNLNEKTHIDFKVD
jgi:hypothetical protein